MAGLVAAEVRVAASDGVSTGEYGFEVSIAGNSSQIEGFPRNLKILKCCVDFLRL